MKAEILLKFVCVCVKRRKKFIEKVPMIYVQQFLDDFHMWVFFQAQLAQKTTLVNDSKLKEQEFKEQVRVLFRQIKSVLV